MARTFNSRDIKRVKSEVDELYSQFNNIKNLTGDYRLSVRKNADTLITREVLRILKDIPVEALNREKRGIRVTTLRKHGYKNLADVFSASEHQLSSIYGISQDMARQIKYIANQKAAMAKKDLHIRLNADNRTYEATKLIKSIYQYKTAQAVADEVEKLQYNYKRQIQYALEDVEPAQSGLRWMLSSKLKKQKAENAYYLLRGMLDGEYGDSARAVISTAANLERVPDSAAWDDFQAEPVRFINILEKISPGLLGNDDSMYGLSEDLAREIQDEAFFPDGLLCELRRYQEWGVKYILHQGKVLLGDEMGLGKTIQAIATMVSLRNTGATHFMVVCPASVIINWCREIRTKSKLRVTSVHGSDRLAALNSWVATGGVAVTTYETTEFITLHSEFRFSLLVVDEAHYIKNPDARRSRNVKRISMQAERLLFMTGTALENKVAEMVSLIQLLRPDIASSLAGMEFLSAAPAFRKKVAPVYYRRKREDVLTELPEKIEYREWCRLLPEEEKAYEAAVLGRSYADSRRVSWNVDDISKSSKARRLSEIVADAESDGRKVIVFSFFLDTISKVQSLLGKKCVRSINGSISPARRQEIIDEFDKAPAGTVLAAQIQSGGTGLNIQAASVVVICEPQLKPSIENQAISRAYRMGQTRTVLIYRLLCADTIDEKMMDMLEEKQTIFDAFADKSEAAKESIELDDKTFKNIIEEEINRINAKKGRQGA